LSAVLGLEINIWDRQLATTLISAELRDSLREVSHFFRLCCYVAGGRRDTT
jgi:hypothetical protein